MKLAVSNIAWPSSQDVEVGEILNRNGYGGLEVAPTKIWQNPLDASASEVTQYRKQWNEMGLEIVAAQSLLFGHPEMTVFESQEKRNATVSYLKQIARLCSDLGAKSLVFGSPKNRRVGGLSPSEVRGIALDFFGELGVYASEVGTSFVLEANPADYGADFVTCADEATAIVREINHPGLRLHLCTGCMKLSGDDVSAEITKGAELLGHFHISEPFLTPPDEGATQVDHPAAAAALAGIAYDGWCSIEMRESEPFTLDGFEKILGYVSDCYIC